jgi:hypothetical protein
MTSLKEILEKKRIKAIIWQGPDESLNHESQWNVEIMAPGWEDDRPFDTLQEAYDYIGRWAEGRGVACSVDFGMLVCKPFSVTDQT